MLRMTSEAVELLDKPQPLRPGEALNAPGLEAFLKARFPDLSGPIIIEQFRKGYSNLTYLIRVGEREMVLRTRSWPRSLSQKR